MREPGPRKTHPPNPLLCSKDFLLGICSFAWAFATGLDRLFFYKKPLEEAMEASARPVTAQPVLRQTEIPGTGCRWDACVGQQTG